MESARPIRIKVQLPNGAPIRFFQISLPLPRRRAPISSWILMSLQAIESESSLPLVRSNATPWQRCGLPSDMDGEAKLPVRAVAPRNLIRPVGPSNPDTTSSSSSSTLSSSNSPPGLFRDLQAAFKRHRPIGTYCFNLSRFTCFSYSRDTVPHLT